MNGASGGGGGGGGGAQYGSEDDYEDFKGIPGVGSAFYSSGGGGPSSSIPGGGNHGLNYSTGGGGGSSRTQICCLLEEGKRCNRGAGNASYSKRIQKTVHYKRLKLEIDINANHIYICDYHKMVIQNARSRQKKDSDDEINDGAEDMPEVDLFQLQVNTLRRYKKHFKIPSRPGINKAQLADILGRHFKNIPVSEKETVTYFIYMVKAAKNRLDNPNRPENGGEKRDRIDSGFVDRY